MAEVGYVHVRGQRDGPEVADILRAHWSEYREKHGATAEQAQAAWALMACRTPVLGGLVYECSRIVTEVSDR